MNSRLKMETVGAFALPSGLSRALADPATSQTPERAACSSENVSPASAPNYRAPLMLMIFPSGTSSIRWTAKNIPFSSAPPSSIAATAAKPPAWPRQVTKRNGNDPLTSSNEAISPCASLSASVVIDCRVRKQATNAPHASASGRDSEAHADVFAKRLR
jgi:hypothetical protein